MAHGAKRAGARNRLRLWLILFFVALAVPSAILFHQAYSRLKWESLHQYRLLAEDWATRVDARLSELVAREEARGFAEYAFLVVEGEPGATFLQRSPLSAYPVTGGLPGTVGYFQVDDDGLFTTPVLPDPSLSGSAYGLTAREIDQRRALAVRMRQILEHTHLSRRDAAGDAEIAGGGRASDALAAEELPVPGAGQLSSRERPAAATMDAAAPPPQQQSDQRSAPQRLPSAADGPAHAVQPQRRLQVSDLQLDDSYRQNTGAVPGIDEPAAEPAAAQARVGRKERSALPAAPVPGSGEVFAPGALSELRVSFFESDIDPFEMERPDEQHLVFFRKAWREGRRYVQGIVLARDAFLVGLLEASFRESALSGMSDLVVAFRGEVLAVVSGESGGRYPSSARDLGGTLLYRTRMSAPAGELELLVTLNRLPAVTGSEVVFWSAAMLAALLLVGIWLIYRLGLRQLDLSEQQQDFIAAVSHELKTPLTSIRMYAEMLREGWVGEDKRRASYDYIHEESERLSRLIENVLQLARMTRRELALDLQTVSVSDLLELAESKIVSVLQAAGFELHRHCPPDLRGALVRVDQDCFAQVLINLADNAVKFAAKAPRRQLDIECARSGRGRLCIAVRDYGPGVPRDQTGRVFKLFYRASEERDRESAGTGIGLALVRQLVLAMGGQVDLRNREPGLEVALVLDIVGTSHSGTER